MRFRILGPLEVLSPDGWTAISAAKWRSLLACLLSGRASSCRRSTLIYELWGDSPPGTANNLVSIYVHRLRRSSATPSAGYSYTGRPGTCCGSHLGPGHPAVRVAGRGGQGRAGGRRCAARGRAARRGARTMARTAARRRPAVAAAATQADRAAELLARHDRAARRGGPRVRPGGPGDSRVARTGGGASDARAALALLMRALEDAGRRAEALEAYAQPREVIADELGVDPGTELQRLYAELLAADASPPSSAARPATRPRPLRAVTGTVEALVVPGGSAARPGTGGMRVEIRGRAGTGGPSSRARLGASRSVLSPDRPRLGRG